MHRVTVRGDIVAHMSSGIDRSEVVVVCVTPAYISKVSGSGRNGFDDHCKFECAWPEDLASNTCLLTVLEYVWSHGRAVDYARIRKGVKKIIPVVTDPSSLDQSTWWGAIGATLGQRFYVDLSGDLSNEAYRVAKIDELMTLINEARLGLHPGDDRATADLLKLRIGATATGDGQTGATSCISSSDERSAACGGHPLLVV